MQLQQGNNCNNKMLLIPSSTTTNQWPQQKQINNIIDDPESSKAMEKKPAQLPQQQSQSQPQPQQQQLPPPPHLKCPRCDSSNTKFCYYNNYSLSQPRHFCKACKRYWTRGGTLRNVPVGGGCRKNKRVKRPSGTSSSSSSLIDHHVTSSSSSNPNNPNFDLSSTSNHVNPMFYGLPTNPSELNLSFPRFNPRVSSVDTVSGHYDVQPQMNALGLGFSSGLMGSDRHHVPNSNSLLSSYPIFGSSTSSSTSPSMASIIASSLQQQRYMGLNSYDEEGVNFGKELKMEDNANRLDWNFNPQNQIGQIGSSDPNSLVWNTSSGVGAGAWLDPSNIGSSVPSLI